MHSYNSIFRYPVSAFARKSRYLDYNNDHCQKHYNNNCKKENTPLTQTQGVSVCEIPEHCNQRNASGIAHHNEDFEND